MSLRLRAPNLTTSLMLLGIAALVAVLGSPAFTAPRAARIETRAEEAAAALLKVAEGLAPTDLRQPDVIAAISEAFVEACDTLGHPETYHPVLRELPAVLVEEDCAAITYESRHYCFLLTRGRPVLVTDKDGGVEAPAAEDGAVKEGGQDASSDKGDDKPESKPTARAPSKPRGPLQVYAWPQTLRPPGHTVFFFGSENHPAYTRNLMHQYVGWDENREARRRLPRPDAGVPRRRLGESEGYYRGRDDERWLLLRL